MMTNFPTKPVNANESRLPKEKSANERDERNDAFAGLFFALNNTTQNDVKEKSPKNESYDLAVLNNRRRIQDTQESYDLAVLNNRRKIQDVQTIPIQNRDKSKPPLLALNEQLTENEPLNQTQQPLSQDVSAEINQLGDVAAKAYSLNSASIKQDEAITLLEAKGEAIKPETIGEINIKAELFANAPTQAVKETLIAKDVQLLSNAKASSKTNASIFSEIKNADGKSDLKKTEENSSNTTQEQGTSVEQTQEESRTSDAGDSKNQNQQFNSSDNAQFENQENVFSKDFESAFNPETSKTIESSSSLSSTLRNTTADTNVPQIMSQTLAALVAAAKSAQPNQEIRFLRFHLNPEKFGALEIKIQSDIQGRLSAQLMTENETARRALNDGMLQLKRELEDAGFQIERLNVNIGQSMTRQSNTQSDGQEFSSKEFTDTSFSVPTEKQTNNSESEIEKDRLLSVRA